MGFNKYNVRVWTGFNWIWVGSRAGSSKHGMELRIPQKLGKFLTS